MANQNDNKVTLADLDLSGIEGFEGFENTDDNTPIEPVEPVEPVGDDEPVEPVETVEPVEPKDDGPISWGEIEDIVPEPLHEDIKPLVEEWRRQYQRVIEEATPYRKYAEQGFTEKDMDMAVQIQRALIQDPRKFYDGLGETYGWGRDAQAAEQLAQQQAAIQAQKRQRPNNNDNLFMDEWDDSTEQQAPEDDSPASKQLAEAMARLERMEQYQNDTNTRQVQEQQQAAGRAQLDSELNKLQEKYGDFNRQEVVKRAIANSSQGGEPSVSKAFHEMRDYDENIRRKYASKRPPKVMGSGNGMNAPEPPDLTSEDSKRSAALALAIRLGAQQ